ncbi:MAG: hypothetical protein WD066_05200 [Planctomycetaceae bacterium]
MRVLVFACRADSTLRRVFEILKEQEDGTTVDLAGESRPTIEIRTSSGMALQMIGLGASRDGGHRNEECEC